MKQILLNLAQKKWSRNPALIRPCRSCPWGPQWRMWQALTPPQYCPWFFFPSSTLTLIPLPFVSVSFGTHGLLIRALALSPLCVFSTLQILLSHYFSLSWPFLVQGKVVASFLLQVQVPDLCLILSPFPSSNAPGWGSHSLAGPCLPRGQSGDGLCAESGPSPSPASQDWEDLV